VPALEVVFEAIPVRAIAHGVEVDIARGGTLRAERVLVATGAFIDACGLWPIDLKLRLFGRTVLLATPPIHEGDRARVECCFTVELRFSLVCQLPRWVRDRCARTLQ
jgi:glycine/D-amino acid oxidase-like deaminating enzyme